MDTAQITAIQTHSPREACLSRTRTGKRSRDSLRPTSNSQAPTKLEKTSVVEVSSTLHACTPGSNHQGTQILGCSKALWGQIGSHPHCPCTLHIRTHAKPAHARTCRDILRGIHYTFHSKQNRESASGTCQQPAKVLRRIIPFSIDPLHVAHRSVYSFIRNV